MKKKIVMMFLLAAVAVTGSFAQDAETSVASNEIFGVELGFVAGYSLLAEEPVAGRQFDLNLNVGENVQVGLIGIDGQSNLAALSMFRFSYFLVPNISLDLYLGKNAAADISSGIGGSFVIASTKGDLGVNTGLKLKSTYLFDETNGIDKGVFTIGLFGSIGL